MLEKNNNISIVDTKNKNSSETIREATFNFDSYFNVIPSQIKKPNKEFLIWFIGFIEGDGCFHYDEKNNRNFFLVSQKDPKPLYYIKKQLGFGIIYKKQISYQYYVSDQINIDRLIRIFNGNLQLEKTKKRFKTWFNLYKNYTKIDEKLNFSNCIENKISLNNSWISGFIDAEGCFTATLKKDSRYKSGYKLALCFILDQKLEDPILSYIGILFGKNNIKSRKEIEGMSRLEMYSNFDILLNYLSRFPLKTSKNLSLKRWLRLFFYTKQENLYETTQSSKAFLKLQRLLKSINNKDLKVEDRVRPI